MTNDSCSCSGSFRLLSFNQRHLHSVLRPQRYYWLESDWVMGHHAQAPLLGQSRYQENPFHPGKAFSNAASRPAAEREIRKLRSRLAGFGCPALWIKVERVRIISLVAVHDVLTHQHKRSSRDKISTNLTIHRRESPNRPGRRVKTHRFGEDHLGIAQPGHVCESRRV